jgi:hypothetical protein
MLRLCLSFCLCLFFFSSIKAQDDPIQITSGSGGNVGRFDHTYRFDFQNSDSSLVANILLINRFGGIAGVAGPDGFIRFPLNASGNDGIGTFTYQGVTWFSFSNFLIVGTVLTPLNPPLSEPFQVTGTFIMDGTLFGQDSPTNPVETFCCLPITGVGSLTATVIYDGFLFRVQNINYTFEAVPEPGIGPPQNKEECKNGGWQTFNTPRIFKNQGDCIQFVNTGR